MPIPVPIFDKWFIHENGEWTEYLAVDSRYTQYWRGEGKEGYVKSCSIMANKKKGVPRIGIPPVMTDGTRSMGRPITEISFDDVPDEVKKVWKRELASIKKFCNEEDEEYYKTNGIDYWNVINVKGDSDVGI